ncbi:hypothetical protein [Dethiosulfatarculus sandiegensis]|uniref:DNA-binding protein n=1 Tax=Dethiosulfatarculus sandiegensis TaxID=1429043 RepID=A0A0D2HVL4_9BACT|nr:hypothetical protein [Dethiosulfatarculus sandiegensis]KIX14428.1 hypothetical protein X474_09835 [Dethiosulfatarculus sandiegensis]
MCVENGFLQGMKSISDYVGFSERTILKHKKSFPLMPIQKVGGVWVGDPEGLTAFYRSLARGEENQRTVQAV